MAVSNKAEYVNYKGGSGVWMHIKDWAINKWFQLISIIMLLKAVIQLCKNKAVLSFENSTVW